MSDAITKIKNCGEITKDELLDLINNNHILVDIVNWYNYIVLQVDIGDGEKYFLKYIRGNGIINHIIFESIKS